MRIVIDPGKERRTINFIDNICFSHVTDLEGNPLDLYLSLMVQNGNSEMRLASGRDDEVSTGLQPLIVWINGAGWRKCDKNLMAAEIQYFAEHGYAVAFIEYRHSGIAYFPAQACDALNAIRYLRKTHAAWGIDPDRIILAGDSSGGHTAVWGGLLHNDETEQNLFPGISAEVCGIVNYYGSVSVMEPDSNPQTVNHCLPDSPEGRVMGGKNLLENDMELAKVLSAECHIDENTKIAPMLIFHGTKDRTVNCTGSVILYNRLKETGHDVTMYLIQGADHGGPEFWTEEVLDIVEGFMKKCFE